MLDRIRVAERCLPGDVDRASHIRKTANDFVLVHDRGGAPRFYRVASDKLVTV